MTTVEPPAARTAPSYAARPWWRSSRRIIGVAIIGCWLWLLLANVSVMPRETSAAELRSAVSSGAITGWRFTDQQPSINTITTGPFSGLGDDSSASVPADGAGFLVWTDGSQRLHWLSTSALWSRGLSSGDVIQQWLSAGYAARHGQDAIPATPGGVPPRVTIPAAVLLLVGLAGICGGDRPRRGNRWFWFWVAGITLGAGLVAYAILECLRDPLERTPRRSGLHGFCYLLGGSVVVGIGLDAIQALLL